MKAPSAGHDEYPRPQRADPVFLRRPGRTTSASPNVLRQCLQLIALFPLLIRIRLSGLPPLSRTAKACLSTTAGGGAIHRGKHPAYPAAGLPAIPQLEARVLDLALMLHAEHGGGNNSTFTTHVVTSSGTDTYSVIASALGSLKGPKHGGANIKVVRMFEDLKQTVKDWRDEEEISRYLTALLHREAFDQGGAYLRHGPRGILPVRPPGQHHRSPSSSASAQAKGRGEEYALYATVARLAPTDHLRGSGASTRASAANVDFYSGFVYSMLDLPLELYTPIFRRQPHCRVERPPPGRAGQRRQDYPPRLQVRAARNALCAAAPALKADLQKPQSPCPRQGLFCVRRGGQRAAPFWGPKSKRAAGRAVRPLRFLLCISVDVSGFPVQGSLNFQRSTVHTKILRTQNGFIFPTAVPEKIDRIKAAL